MVGHPQGTAVPRGKPVKREPAGGPAAPDPTDKLACEVRVIHRDVVEAARKNLPDEAACGAMAEIFKAMGEPTRLRILWCLAEREMCVCDITAALSLSQSLVSHQLRILRQLKLVKHRREGKMVFYSLDDEHVKSLLQQAGDHVGEEASDE